MSGCIACDRAEMPPKTRAMEYAEALIVEHHVLLRSERERADRLAETEATTSRALAKALAERDAAQQEVEELRKSWDERNASLNRIIDQRDAARAENVELRRKLREGFCGKCDYEGGNLVDDLTKDRDAAQKEAEELLRRLQALAERCELRGDTNEGLLLERDAARREVAELRLKYDCGKDPCAFIGGFCLKHSVAYYRLLESVNAEMREVRDKARARDAESRAALEVIAEKPGLQASSYQFLARHVLERKEGP